MDLERSTPEPHRTTLARRAKRKPPKPKRKRTPKSSAHELQVEQRRAKVTDLRIKGHSIRAIAEQLGCSLATVHGDIEAVLLRATDESKTRMEQSRELSLRRLDAANLAMWPQVQKGDPEAVRTLVRIEERRAKLEGHDAATGSRLELTGAGGGPIEVAEAKTGLARKLDDLKTRLRSVPPAAS
ncbi:MAG TPA: helix-turn-helix domain-containing protein [Polyangiales bacterium]|jgi:transposase|nr:helix-turn-helix domain-containing protein [Polyangiales bacterium]